MWLEPSPTPRNTLEPKFEPPDKVFFFKYSSIPPFLTSLFDALVILYLSLKSCLLSIYLLIVVLLQLRASPAFLVDV